MKATRRNRIKTSGDVILMRTLVHAMLILFVLITIFPMVLTVVVSFSSQGSIMERGYSLIPTEWSLDAYKYLLNSPNQLINGYKNSITITLVGTVVNLILTAMIAYPLSRPDFDYRGGLSKFIFVPMMFSGGMVASYILVVQFLGWRNNLLSVIVPGMLGSFNIFLMRVLFQGVPFSTQEAAKIDGASDWRIFWQILLPMSKPALATVGLQYVLGYWNDTSGPQLYLNRKELYPITLVLNNIVSTVDEMKKALLDPSRMGGIQIRAEDIPSDSIMFALMVISTVPLLVVFLRLQKYFVKGMVAGAVKG